MKKLIILLFLIMPVVTFAQYVDIDGIRYHILSEEEMTAEAEYGNLCSRDTLKIPATILYENKKYTVTTIGEEVLNYDPHYPSGIFAKVLIIPHTISVIKFNPSYTDLENIIVDNDNPVYASYYGLLYSKDFKTLIGCPKNNPASKFHPYIEEIAQIAFSHCEKIGVLEIPPTVHSIGSSAFMWSSIWAIYLPKNLKVIKDSCFEHSNLVKVVLPEDLVQIEGRAFMSCNYLSEMNDIPESVKSIGPFAFYGAAIKSFSLPTGLEYLGMYSLQSSGLSSIFCHADVALSCDEDIPFIISTSLYNKVAIYVPVGSLESYQNTYPWSLFKNIKEYDYSSNTPVEAAGIDIRAEGGAIVVSGNEAVPVEVYRTDGTLVRRTSDSRIDGLPRGLYIVKVAGSIKKVAL